MAEECDFGLFSDDDDNGDEDFFFEATLTAEQDTVMADVDCSVLPGHLQDESVSKVGSCEFVSTVDVRQGKCILYCKDLPAGAKNKQPANFGTRIGHVC